VLLAAAGAAQRWVPMPRWSQVLGRVTPVPPQWLGRRNPALGVRVADVEERRVAVAVRRAARALPWRPTCLAEAVAGQVLLRQAGSSGVVVIGLRRPDDPAADRWDAHAWLLGRAGALTGGPAAAGFTAAPVFEVPGGLRAVELAP